MTKSQIEKTCKTLKDVLGLKNWDINYVWLKADSKEIKDITLVPANSTVSAFVKTTPKYQRAVIYFNEGEIFNIDAWLILHEFMHIVHSPFREYVGEKCKVNDAWEMFSYLEENFIVNLEFIIGRAMFNPEFKKLVTGTVKKKLKKGK
jgi:hypothetical protein